MAEVDLQNEERIRRRDRSVRLCFIVFAVLVLLAAIALCDFSDKFGFFFLMAITMVGPSIVLRGGPRVLAILPLMGSLGLGIAALESRMNRRSIREMMAARMGTQPAGSDSATESATRAVRGELP